MPRLSAKQQAGISGLQNLNALHELAEEGGGNATYTGNAGDARRWAQQVRDAGMEYPAWMQRNSGYFTTIWSLPKTRFV